MSTIWANIVLKLIGAIISAYNVTYLILKDLCDS